MYRVKLAVKSIDEITVDGITITHKWKRIEEKTKFLEELEKEGKIIIKEVKDEENIRTKFKSYQDFKEEMSRIFEASSSRHFLEEMNRKLEASSSIHFLEEMNRKLKASSARHLQEVINKTLSASSFLDAQLKIGTMLSDALMEVKREIKPHTEPETKEEQNKVEQKPISTEQNELNQKINDIEERIEDIYNIKEDDYKYKSLLEKVEKIVVRMDALENRADKNENTRDIKPDAIKKADIKKIVWMKTRKQLVFIIQQLSDEGFLLIVGNIDNIITNHFITKEDKPVRKDVDIERIRWVGTLSHLVFFTDRLIDYNFLSKADFYETDNLIYNHFGDQEGNPFKKNIIKGTRHRVRHINRNQMVKGGEKILEIIQKALNINE